MADKTEFLQAIDDAILDADSLEKFVNGSDTESVLTRLSAEYPTLQKAIKQMFINGGLPATPFKTNADMEASSLDDGSYAVVTNDSDSESNGLYVKDSGSWIRSNYNNLEQIASKILNPINNIIVNGYFAKGTNSWYPLRSTHSVIDNNLVVTNQIAGDDVSGFARTPVIQIKKGNKYLLKTRFKVDSADCEYVLFGNASSYDEQYIRYDRPPANEWVEVIGYLTGIKSGNFNISHAYKDGDTANNKTLTLDYVELLDITDVLGSTSLSLDAISDIVSGGLAPYYVTVSDVLENLPDLMESVKLGGELFNPDAVIKGSAISTLDGVLSNYDDRFVTTGFIDVSNLAEIELSGFATQNMTMGFYDSKGVIVSLIAHYYPNTSTPIPNTKWVLNGRLDVPDNAHYFVRNIRNPLRGEIFGNISIKGTKTRANADTGGGIAKKDPLPLSDTDTNTIIKTHLFSTDSSVSGYVDESGITEDASGFTYSGILNVENYNYVLIEGAESYELSRHWLDSSRNVIDSIAMTDGTGRYIRNGLMRKPSGAKYFAANVSNPDFSESNMTIYGARHLDTSDFLKRGEGGDANQGWGNTLKAMQTTKQVEISNPYFPEIKPLRIIHYGKADNYTVGGGYGERIEFDTEIFRLAWGIQICMNTTKPALINATSREDFTTDNVWNVKTLKAYNGLLAEWGVEGFSWHVSPPGADWGKRAWMNLKVGGHGPRGYAQYPYQHGSTVQFFVPEWTERRDTTNSEGGGWTQSSTNPTRDDEYPTKTMIRQSAHFKSPEFYRATHGNTVDAGWDHYVRTRGTVANPTPAENGDCIHKEVFSVGTGAVKTGLPDTKEVAMMEVRYKEGDPNYEAEFIFKLKNKITGEWDEVAKH